MSRPEWFSTRWRAEFLAASLCVIFGIAISTLPHLLWWPKLGEPVWVADTDELGEYLPAGAKAYNDHPFYLSDPMRSSGGATIYSWLQLIPGVLLAKALGLGPMGLGLAWRFLAGLTIPIAWYLLLRHHVEQPWVAASLAILLMSDIGLVTGWPLVKQMLVAARLLLSGHHPILAETAQLHVQWRIMTPGLSLAYLILHIWLLDRAVEKPSRPRILMSAAGFGLLFYVYFFFWTAAGLALLAAWAFDVRRRWTYFHTGWLGGLIGLPAIVSGTILKNANAPQWFYRSEKFIEIPHFNELLFPKAGFILLTACLPYVWLRRKDLFYLWALAASGMALVDHQIITGLYIDNFHWMFVWGPALCLLIALLCAGALRGRLSRPGPAAWALLSLAALQGCAGLYLRTVEALRTRQPVEFTRLYESYRRQRLAPGVPRLIPNSMTAGDSLFVHYSVVLENQLALVHRSVLVSPSISNPEWNERIALDCFLNGMDRRTFEESQIMDLRPGHSYGPWSRFPEKRRERLDSLLADYDAVAAAPAAAMDRFGVRYVGLPFGQAPPSYLKSGWRRLQAGPYWQVWSRG